MRRASDRPAPTAVRALCKAALLLAAASIASCASIGLESSGHGALAQGLSLYNQERYREAIPHFDRAMRIDPGLPEAHLYKGKAYLALGRPIDAVPPLREAYRLLPDEDKARVASALLDGLLRAAVAALRAGRADDSARLLRGARELAPALPASRDRLLETLLAIGRELLRKGEIRAASEILREAHALAPNAAPAREALAGALVALGRELLESRRTREAIDAYADAARLAPGHMDAYIGLAEAYYLSGELGEALEHILEVLQSSPADPDARALYRLLATE